MRLCGWVFLRMGYNHKNGNFLGFLNSGILEVTGSLQIKMSRNSCGHFSTVITYGPFKILIHWNHQMYPCYFIPNEIQSWTDSPGLCLLVKQEDLACETGEPQGLGMGTWSTSTDRCFIHIPHKILSAQEFSTSETALNNSTILLKTFNEIFLLPYKLEALLPW